MESTAEVIDRETQQVRKQMEHLRKKKHACVLGKSMKLSFCKGGKCSQAVRVEKFWIKYGLNRLKPNIYLAPGKLKSGP